MRVGVSGDVEQSPAAQTAWGGRNRRFWAGRIVAAGPKATGRY